MGDGLRQLASDASSPNTSPRAAFRMGDGLETIEREKPMSKAAAAFKSQLDRQAADIGVMLSQLDLDPQETQRIDITIRACAAAIVYASWGAAMSSLPQGSRPHQQLGSVLADLRAALNEWSGAPRAH